MQEHWYVVRCKLARLGYGPHPETAPGRPRQPLGFGPVRISAGVDSSEWFEYVQVYMGAVNTTVYVKFSNEQALYSMLNLANRDALRLAIDLILVYISVTLDKLWHNLLKLISR